MGNSSSSGPELRTEPGEVQNLRTACLRLRVRPPCRLSDWIAPQEVVIFNFQGNVDRLVQLDRFKFDMLVNKSERRRHPTPNVRAVFTLMFVGKRPEERLARCSSALHPTLMRTRRRVCQKPLLPRSPRRS